MNNTSETPKRRGCLFYGCLTLIILTLFGATVLYLGYRYTMKTVTRLANDFTDTAPAELETVELPPDRQRNIQERVARFTRALETQQSAEELVLTAEEINALIGADPSFKDAKGRVFVRIDGDKLKGKVSMPLPDIGPFKLNGRYLNGEATFNVALTNGTLFVGVLDVEVKGRPLPAQLMTVLRQENLARDVMNNPQAAQNLAKFESIEVKDGKLILRNRAAGNR